MATDASLSPNISKFSINGALTGSFPAIESRLSTIQTLLIKQNPEGLVVLSVESRDMEKNPFLFFIFTFKQNGIDVQYSIAPDASEKLRRLYVLKNLLSLLSLITDNYSVDQPTFFQYVDSAIDDVLGSLSQSYSALFNNYDSLFNEYRETKRLNIELMQSNKNLSVKATQLSKESDELKARLSALETYSEESLMVMIQDWLEAHNNTIDIGEFSKTYRVIQPRVEQVLNKMVAQSYIEFKG